MRHVTRPRAHDRIEPCQSEDRKDGADYLMEKLFENAPEVAKTALRRCFDGVSGCSHPSILAHNVWRDGAADFYPRRLATTLRFYRFSTGAQAGVPVLPARKDCEHFGDNGLTVSCIQRSVSLEWPRVGEMHLAT